MKRIDDEYSHIPNRQLAYYYRHREKVIKGQIKYYFENKEAIENRRIKRKYGVDIKKDSCELCGSTKRLNVDHDHDTQEFRGVLCNKCNTAIGWLGDTIKDIERVLLYLRGNKMELYDD